MEKQNREKQQAGQLPAEGIADGGNSTKSKKLTWLKFGAAFLLFVILLLGTAYWFSHDGAKNLTSTAIAGEKLDCDYLISGGLVVDGTGREGYFADIAIKDEIIVGIGKLQTRAKADVVIDATGKVVTPGFIDLHTHTEEYWATSPDGSPALCQGITTEIGGNCGTSVQDVGSYLNKLKRAGIPINVGMLTGYKVLRAQAGVGGETTAEQLEKMAKLLTKSLDAGSFGFSAGLGYAPQSLAYTNELIELAKVVAAKNRLFALHSRNEYDDVQASMAEAIVIAKASLVRFEYSHIKAAGFENFGKMPIVLEMLNDTVAQGYDMEADIYGYTFSSNDGGGNVSMLEDNVKLGMTNPNVMIASDGGLYGGGRATYPRAYGNAVRILEKYVKDEHLMSLGTAVHKMSLQPAWRLNLTDRGLLALGKKADINVFNLGEIHETATRANPMSPAVGMSYVFVNGKPAIAEGKLTGVKAGEALHSHD